MAAVADRVDDAVEAVDVLAQHADLLVRPQARPALVDEDGLAGVVVRVPAGQGERCVLDVGLGDMLLADGEQLLEFAGVVLVRALDGGPAAIQVDQHRGRDRDLLEERPVVAHGVAAEGHVGRPLHLPPVHLAVADGHDPVPEPGHLLVHAGSMTGHLRQPPLDRVGRIVVGQVWRMSGGQWVPREHRRDGLPGSLPDVCLHLPRIGTEGRPTQDVGDELCGRGCHRARH